MICEQKYAQKVTLSEGGYLRYQIEGYKAKVT